MRDVLFFSYHFYTYVSLEREAECVGYRDFSTINVLGGTKRDLPYREERRIVSA